MGRRWLEALAVALAVALFVASGAVLMMRWAWGSVSGTPAPSGTVPRWVWDSSEEPWCPPPV